MSPLRTSATVVAFLIGAGGNVWASDFTSACQISQEQRDELGCVCVVARASPAALLDDIVGSVLKSDAHGFTPVSEQAWLEIGDSVLVGEESRASLLSGPTCNVAVGPKASLVLRAIDENCACAALVEEKKPAHAGGGLAHVALGAGALIALGVHLIPVSP